MSINPVFRAEAKLAQIDSAMNFIRDAQQLQLNIACNRVPYGCLHATNQESNDLLQSAIDLLNNGMAA